MKEINILKIKPKKYLEQKIRYCGGYTIKAILSAYDKDDNKKPEEYTGRLSIVTSKRIKNILEHYGLSANIKMAYKFSKNKKIEILKNELNNNHPLILLIGNGYFKNGEYFWLKRYLIAHWISILGYNDKEKIFYLYDPYINKKENIPIGNVKRYYSQLLRDWKGTFYTKGYLYISAKEKSE